MIKGTRLLAHKFANNYTQSMYQAWKTNPSDVHEDWHEAFSNTNSPNDTQVDSKDIEK